MELTPTFLNTIIWRISHMISSVDDWRLFLMLQSKIRYQSGRSALVISSGKLCVQTSYYHWVALVKF